MLTAHTLWQQALHHQGLDLPDGLTNDGARTAFKIGDLDVSASKNNQQTTLSGSFGRGGSWSLDIQGDPHVTLNITRPDGSTSSQKFDFKEGGAFNLPDGRTLFVGTNGGAGGGATFVDRIGILSQDQRTMTTVRNINSPGALEVGTHAMHGNAMGFASREFGGPSGFSGNVYNLTRHGMTTGEGRRADNASVAHMESRPDRQSRHALGRDLAVKALAQGLRPPGGGAINVYELGTQLAAMALGGGGFMPMYRGDERCGCLVQGSGGWPAGGDDDGFGFDGGGHGGYGGFGSDGAGGSGFFDSLAAQYGDSLSGASDDGMDPALASWILGDFLGQQNSDAMGGDMLDSLKDSHDFFIQLAAKCMVDNMPPALRDQMAVQGVLSQADFCRHAGHHDYC